MMMPEEHQGRLDRASTTAAQHPPAMQHPNGADNAIRFAIVHTGAARCPAHRRLSKITANSRLSGNSPGRYGAIVARPATNPPTSPESARHCPRPDACGQTQKAGPPGRPFRKIVVAFSVRRSRPSLVPGSQASAPRGGCGSGEPKAGSVPGWRRRWSLRISANGAFWSFSSPS